jgi:hypothetical protein
MLIYFRVVSGNFNSFLFGKSTTIAYLIMWLSSRLTRIVWLPGRLMQLLIFKGEIYFQDALKIVLVNRQISVIGSKASGPDPGRRSGFYLSYPPL